MKIMVIKMKPVKYILFITLVLFIFVFLVTLPGRLKSNKNADSSSSSETTSTVTTALPVETSIANGTSAIIVGGDPKGTSTSAAAAVTSAATSINSTTTTGVNSMENNSSWALYLINQAHPLADDFDVTAKKVSGTYSMDVRCADYMISMIADAKSAGINLNIVSAYRSLDKQTANFNADVKKYEGQGMTHDEAYKETAKNIAIPGQSEHNAGLAADILSNDYTSLDSGFENTKAFSWLNENAYKYGFILRYPKDKTDITLINYEPWHYRFVGVEYAKKIKDSGLCLEEYCSQQH